MVYFMEHSIKAIHEKEQAAAGGGGGTSPEDKERITKLEDGLEGRPQGGRQPRGRRSLHPRRAELALLPSPQHQQQPGHRAGQ